MRRVLELLSIVAILSLTACGQADTLPTTAEAAVVEPTATTTATPAPTVSAPTATPTPAPTTPTVTPTRPPATATRRPTATPSPTATPHLYIVQEADTLLGIALDLGISVEDLLTANPPVSETDFLQLGQELVIPTVPATETAQATAPPVLSPTPAASVDQTNVAAGESAPALPPTPTPAVPPLPTVTHPPDINPLTGLPVDDPALLQRRPLLVRIGNDVGARQSQVGFNSADIVYEEITEWWVTRFTAIFLTNTPDTVGPVRSARLINVQLAPQYQGALAHSGGSDPVRWEISQAPITNLDEYYHPSPYFYRPNQGWQTRLAIDTQAARNYLIAKNLDAPVRQQGFLFSDTLDRGEPAENIFIPYPRATSFTQWSYDPASGQYLRYIADQPLVDAGRGQVTAANVIVYFAQHQETDIVEDSNGATSIRIIINGAGPAWFFRDGKLNKGFWATDGSRTPYFTYEDGTPYSLKPGNSWIEVVPTSYKIGLNSPDEASSR